MKQIKSKINNHDFANIIHPKLCPNNSYMPAILPAVDRIVCLGDIHGSYSLAIDMLIIGKIIKIVNGSVMWNAGNTYVVQVGDQVDRCRPIDNMTCENPNTTINDEASDIKIMELFNDLHEQAVLQGGAVISLLGNHEIMNSTGQLQYVSYQGLKQFENYVDKDKPNIIFPNGATARAHAFAPGNEYGKMMGCSRHVVVIIGSHMFLHAGLVDSLIHEIGLNGIDDLQNIDTAIRSWLLGLLHKDYIRKIIKNSKNSLFWTRLLGSIPPNVSLDNPVCSTHLKKVLKMFKIGHMVIGHCPTSFTFNADINGTCDNTVFRVDIGASHAFDKFDNTYQSYGKPNQNRRTQVLEILNDNVFNICDSTGCKKYA